MVVQQFVVASSSPTSPLALNVWHFANTNNPDTSAAALEAVYGDFAPVLSDDVDFDLDPVCRLLDETDGSLIGLQGVSWTGPVSGTGVGSRAPDATALLVAWNTDTVHNGRVIRGRTFFPYPAYSVLGEGQVSGGGITALDAAVAAAEAELITAEAVIWSRPTSTVAGAVGNIVSGAGRREYSFQGRRRA